MEYLATLEINHEWVDETSLDAVDFAHAEHLFFEEFGHEKPTDVPVKIFIDPME